MHCNATKSWGKHIPSGVAVSFAYQSGYADVERVGDPFHGIERQVDLPDLNSTYMGGLHLGQCAEFTLQHSLF